MTLSGGQQQQQQRRTTTMGGVWRRGLSLAAALLLLLVPVSLAQDTANANNQDKDDSSQLSSVEILLRFYDETLGLRWTNRTSWLVEEDVCTWFGIECYGDDASDRMVGHVRTVDLSDNHLVGTVPHEIFDLPYLQNLVLRDNADLQIPFQNLGSAQFLQTLVVSNTLVRDLTGVSAVKESLLELHLTNLLLSGNVPEEVFDLTNLRGLYANYNSWTGPLSTAIGQLTDLTELFCYANDLTGQLPTEIGLLTKLEILALAQNEFTGTLPQELDNLSSLRILALARQEEDVDKSDGIKGNLPSLASLSSITEIYLEHQVLSGSIPQDFLQSAPKDQVLTVDLQNNQLTGGVPARLADLTRLNLYLANNLVQLQDDFCASIQNTQWMGGDVTNLGCDAFLCPPLTYSPVGRKSPDADCAACAQNPPGVYGRTTCDATSGTDGNPGLASERTVLTKLYASMGGRYWKDDKFWLSPDTEPCDGWFGIECNSDGKVTSINLKNNGVTGSPPVELWSSLTELSSVQWSSNSLDFKFKGIGGATKLEYLDLSTTETTSLADIQELQETPLRILQLSSNFLLEQVPSEIWGIATLEELYLSHNKLTGALSSDVGNLINLKVLHLYGNQMTGQLPTELGLLTAAKSLVLSENRFEGTLPQELNLLTDIETISLHQTSFDGGGIGGPLPAFQDLKILTKLHLDSNRLTGPLPDDFLLNTERGDGEEDSNRIELFLSDNEFSGGIPASWATRFDSLVVDLSGNQISSLDDFPCPDVSGWMDGEGGDCDAILCPVGTYNEFGRKTDEDAECRACTEEGGALYMGSKDCAENGEVNEEVAIIKEFYYSTGGPSWIDNSGWTTSADHCNEWKGVECNNAGEIVRLGLAENGLTGTPTNRIFDLPALTELDLQGNSMDFNFDGIDKATKLQVLYLSETAISSLQGIGGAKGLLTLHLTSNDIQGELPEELFDLTNLKQLFLNYNRFSGRVPSGIGKLTDVEELYMLHNRFEGQIPAAVGSLKKLRIFSLTDNDITGTLPAEINDMTALEIFAIQRESYSDNGTKLELIPGTSRKGVGLRGPLPSLNKLQNLQKLYLGNNGLTGQIPFDFLDGIADKTAPLEVDLTQNFITGPLPPSLVQFDQMTIFAAGNQIEDIADGLCLKTDWMGGAVATYGCNAILCPDGTSSRFGRQNDDDSPCEPCASGTTANYYGSFSCATGTDQRAKDEREILIAFYNALDGQNWDVSENWLSQDVSVCEWHGVSCSNDDAQHVHDIHLVSLGLKGTVPKDIYKIQGLSVLNLAGNKIEFSFDGIGDSNIEYLNLDSTGLTDTSGIEAAAGKLKVLHLIDNNFGGTFPAGITELVNLEVLYLSENDIGGSLPDGLGGLVKLLFFQCADCGLSGEVPSWLSSLADLENLGLEQNAFTGEFPESIKTLTKLQHLDLSDQHRHGGGLTGTLFNFAGFQDIAEIFLFRNEFNGPIPDDFLQDTKTSQTVTVDLQWNSISGAIPTSLSRFPSMKLYIADNQIDDVPDEICAMTDWNEGQTDSSCDFILCPVGTYSASGRAKPDSPCKTCDQNDTARYYGSTLCTENEEKLVLNALFIDLHGGEWENNDGWLITPDICGWYGITCYDSGDNVGKVKKIELGSNKMDGIVSDSIWDLEFMTWLELRDNNITISSFENIERAKSLETLYLSETPTSFIDGVENAPSLIALHLTSTQLEGPIPNGLYDLVKLQRLYLNYNKLNGPLSPDIGKLSLLQELFFFHNELTGKVPTEIGKLQDIEILALGENQFFGPLPQEMNSLPNLQVLSLQRESGGTPTGSGGVGEASGSGMTGKLLNFDGSPNLQEVYLGANSLTGTVPKSFLSGVANKSQTMQIDLTLNQLQGPIPAELDAFTDMHLYLAGNQINEIPDRIKNMGSWMGGEVENGVDALLCPPGSFNEYGRRVNDDKLCQECGFPDSTQFYGSVSCGPGDGTDLSERQILREFYQATDGNSWSNRDRWLEDNVDICTWHGVRCVDGGSTVEKLELSDNMLQGEVPPIVFHLPSLRVLDLSGNPVTMKFLGIEAAANLEELRIDSTNVVSLHGIGKATSLQVLHAEQNNFGGQIPEDLYDLTELRFLHISDTGFSGTLSDRFGDLNKLKQFYCHGNFISGEIPGTIGNLIEMEHLVLSENMFYGTLPESLNNLGALKLLNLDAFTRQNAGISGPLLSFDEMPKLRELFLGANSLTGTIPDDFLDGIDDKSVIVNVGLKSNQITGKIPGSLSDFDKLNIDLAENKITDIDDALCTKSGWMNGYVEDVGCDAILCPVGTFNKDGRQSTSGLYCIECEDPGASPFMGSTFCAGKEKELEKQVLQLFYQSTNGDEWKQNTGWMDDSVDICQWYGISCRDGLYVESILLGSNNIIGKPPPNLFELSNLEFLWLYSNPIDFSFEGIEKATKLKSILLDSTGLTSLEGIGKGASLIDVDVRYNKLEGTVPSEIRNLHDLESFLCGNNKLTGTIPSFATNRRLKNLRMGDNFFTGTLPSFATQYGITALDLSGNELEGTIPQDLFEQADQSGAIFLDLSSNRLSGTVPGELARFQDATILLRDNMITDVHPDLCEKETFNDGDVGVFGCDGILCPAGKYGPVHGRASQGGDGCSPCDEADYFGASTCGPDTRSGTCATRALAGTVLALCVAVFYAVM